MRSFAALSLIVFIVLTVPSCSGKPNAIQFYEMTCCTLIDDAQYNAAYAQITAGSKKADDFFRGIHTGTTTARGVVFSAHFDRPLPSGRIQIRVRDRVSGKIISSGEYDVGVGQRSLQSYYNLKRAGRYSVEFLAGESIIAQEDITLLEPEQAGPYR